MRLRYDDETEAFRAELREWFAANLPDESERAERVRSSAHIPEWARRWQRKLFDNGWLVPGWPPEYGGRNATPVQQMVFFEELARLGVPRSCNPQGLSIITPSILDHGTEAQKERFALPTLRAEISWCLGMSEPDAGSDLAGLRTRAELVGDRFVVNGQKVWTSGAHDADWCFCFVRTDPEAPKHAGISVLVIDMTTPGIETRPLPELTDRLRADFNEVFLTDVEVPAENLVGELHHGWSIAGGSLAHERGMLWINEAVGLERILGQAVNTAGMQLSALGGTGEDSGGPASGEGGGLAGFGEVGGEAGAGEGGDDRRLRDDPLVRDAVARAYTQAQAMKLLGYKGFAKTSKGKRAPEHTILKLLGSELRRRLALDITEALGPFGLELDRRIAPSYGRRDQEAWALHFLQSFAGTIAGGTSEIQRNIIAERVLDLPRR